MKGIREHLRENCRAYAVGYEIEGRRVSTDTATTIFTRDGTAVSIEIDPDGTYTLFDLTEEQAKRVIDAL